MGSVPARLGLGGIPGNDVVLSVHVRAGYRSLNGKGACSKSMAPPLQAEHRAAAQTIEDGRLH